MHMRQSEEKKIITKTRSKREANNREHKHMHVVIVQNQRTKKV